LPQILKKTLPESPHAPFTVDTTPNDLNKIKFTLNTVKIEGNTVISDEILQQHYQPYLGQKVAATILWQIADNITKHYREQGFFLSKAIVPAQKIERGDIKLEVIEGYFS
ncbi:MAG: POTRA domain-containing protein, partial [Pseudomonadota bacterium]